jgi:hypothetical protein
MSDRAARTTSTLEWSGGVGTRVDVGIVSKCEVLPPDVQNGTGVDLQGLALIAPEADQL